jgi:hypothetical protein
MTTTSTAPTKKVSAYNRTRKGMKYRLRKYDNAPAPLGRPSPPILNQDTSPRIVPAESVLGREQIGEDLHDTAAAAEAAAAVESAAAAAALARSQFEEAHRAAAAAAGAVSAAARLACAADAAVVAARQRQQEVLLAVAREALKERQMPHQPMPHEVHSRSLSADDRAVILAHVRASFVLQMPKGRWEKLVPQVETLLTTFSVAPVLPEAVNKYFKALAAAERAAVRKARQLPLYNRAAAVREEALHAMDVQVLRATLVSVVVRRCPVLLLNSMAELVAEFPEACEDADPQRLLHFRNLLRCGVWLFGGHNHKGMLMSLSGRLSGRMFTTGGGSTTETRRRERLLIQLSGVWPRRNDDNDANPKTGKRDPEIATDSLLTPPRQRYNSLLSASAFQRLHREGDVEVAAVAAAFFASAKVEDDGDDDAVHSVVAVDDVDEDLWSELSSSPDVLQHAVCEENVFDADKTVTAELSALNLILQ